MTAQLLLTFPTPTRPGPWPALGLWLLGEGPNPLTPPAPPPAPHGCACKHAEGRACGLLDGMGRRGAVEAAAWVAGGEVGVCGGRRAP